MSTSEVRGLFVQKLSNGTIVDVRIENSSTGWTISPDEYRLRGIQPPLEALPDQHGATPSETGAAEAP